MASFVLALLAGLLLAGLPPSHGLAQQVDWATMYDVERTEVFPNRLLELVIQLDEELGQLRVESKELKDAIQGLQSAKATLEERVTYLEAITRKNVPQTCQDLKKLGVTDSGSYLVDPDGAGIGDPPVMAACDFSSEYAATVIQHDVRGVVYVDHCEEPGCHRTTVTYEATDRQIKALKALSVECSQDIKYECFASPLIENGVTNMAWWVGNTGEPNYFWDGDHEPSEHVCACNATDSCLNENYQCNCDASAPQWVNDEGVLESDSLPVTELRFGGLVFDGQQATFSLGPLKCSGRKAVNPSDSCDTLRMAGHTASGYYFIDGPGGVHYDLVKCNMDAEKTEAGFQSATAVKLAEGHVAFDFVRNTAFSSVNSVVTYESFYLNDGDAMSTAGTFTAPFDGVYAFLFLYDAHGGAGGDIEIRLNLVRVAHALTHSNSEEYGNGATAILRVLEGQTVDAVNPSDSCDTLRMAGHTASGYYFIDGPGGIHYDLVKCNMDAEASTDMGFQSSTAVKLAQEHVAFDFVRDTAFNASDSVVTYDSFYLNDGDAMSLAGTFTAQFDGVYAFLFLYDAHSTSGDVEIRLDGNRVAAIGSGGGEWGSGTTAIIKVLKGQQVDVKLIAEYGLGGFVKATHFTGFLLYPL